MSLRRCLTVTVIAASSICAVSLSWASKLPSTATTLTINEITAIYADHSVIFSKQAAAFFAADGSVKGYSPKSVFSGKWEIKGNEICMLVSPTDLKTKKLDPTVYSDCWQWMKVGKVKWSLYSKSYDNKPQDMVGGWYKPNNIKPGDLITAKYSALGGQ